MMNYCMTDRSVSQQLWIHVHDDKLLSDRQECFSTTMNTCSDVLDKLLCDWQGVFLNNHECMYMMNYCVADRSISQQLWIHVHDDKLPSDRQECFSTTVNMYMYITNYCVTDRSVSQQPWIHTCTWQTTVWLIGVFLNSCEYMYTTNYCMTDRSVSQQPWTHTCTRQTTVWLTAWWECFSKFWSTLHVYSTWQTSVRLTGVFLVVFADLLPGGAEVQGPHDDGQVALVRDEALPGVEVKAFFKLCDNTNQQQGVMITVINNNTKQSLTTIQNSH